MLRPDNEGIGEKIAITLIELGLECALKGVGHGKSFRNNPQSHRILPRFNRKAEQTYRSTRSVLTVCRTRTGNGTHGPRVEDGSRALQNFSARAVRENRRLPINRYYTH